MLELRRKKGDDIYIFVPGRKKPIRISVNRFVDSGYGQEVELGFNDLDEDIEVLRHELYDERGNT